MWQTVKSGIKIWGSRVAVALLTFLLVAWAMVALPRSNALWVLLDGRFSQDQNYQIHSLFLPDQKQNFPVVIVGDSLFQSAMPTSIKDRSDLTRLTINGYDASDMQAVMRGFNEGRRLTKSEVCTVIIQISPVFAVRAKAIGTTPNYSLIRNARRNTSLAKHVSQFFEIFDKWGATNNDMPSFDTDAGRPARHVGQTRFANPSQENLNIAFSDVHRNRHAVIAVLDTRDTDWGEGSNLIEATQTFLAQQANEHAHLSWTTLDRLAETPILGCKEGA